MAPIAIHIFRRDLRLADNTALIYSLESDLEVLPCFIVDPCQFDPHPYLSLHARNFLIGSLRDLDEQLRELGAQLYLFRGPAAAIVAQLCTALTPKLITVNEDYTPFSRKRDSAIEAEAAKHGTQFTACADILLNDPRSVLTGSGTPYSVFTPYHRNAAARDVAAPRPLPKRTRWFSRENSAAGLKGLITLEELAAGQPQFPQIFLKGGRAEALKLISTLPKRIEDDAARDVPSRGATSHLSAHHKFGTISPRESLAAVQEQFGDSCSLARQLYWRDFFSAIGFHYPHVFGGAFRRKYDALEWSDDPDAFEAWCAGQTGFPIVDAGMRELNTTGFMHNRVRMIVASFLTKDLHINWQLGERYFASKLIDYDPAVNNGSWQWSASTGCDAQPYFRIFNPWLQQKRFDPDTLYVKRWVPELESLTPKQIHKLAERPLTVAGYPAPMVDHREEQARAIRMFESL